MRSTPTKVGDSTATLRLSKTEPTFSVVEIEATPKRQSSRRKQKGKKTNNLSTTTRHAETLVERKNGENISDPSSSSTLQQQKHQQPSPHASRDSFESASLSMTSHIGFEVKDGTGKTYVVNALEAAAHMMDPRSHPCDATAGSKTQVNGKESVTDVSNTMGTQGYGPVQMNMPMTPITVPQQMDYMRGASLMSPDGIPTTHYQQPLFPFQEQDPNISVEEILKAISTSPVSTFLTPSSTSSSVVAKPSSDASTASHQYTSEMMKPVDNSLSFDYLDQNMLHPAISEKESFPFKRLEMIPKTFLEQLGCEEGRSDEAQSTETLAILPPSDDFDSAWPMTLDDESMKKDMVDDLEYKDSFMSLLEGSPANEGSHQNSKIQNTTESKPSTFRSIKAKPSNKSSTNLLEVQNCDVATSEKIQKAVTQPTSKKPETIEKELLENMFQASFGPTLTSPLLLSLSMPLTMNDTFKMPHAPMSGLPGARIDPGFASSMSTTSFMPLASATQGPTVDKIAPTQNAQRRAMPRNQPKSIMAQLSMNSNLSRYSPYARCATPKCLPDLPKRQANMIGHHQAMPFTNMPPWQPSLMNVSMESGVEASFPSWLNPDFMMETNPMSMHVPLMKGPSLAATMMGKMYPTGPVFSNTMSGPVASSTQVSAAKSKGKKQLGKDQSPLLTSLPVSDPLNSFGFLKPNPPAHIVSPEHVVSMPLYPLTAPEASNYIAPSTTVQPPRATPTGGTFSSQAKGASMPTGATVYKHASISGPTIASKPNSKKSTSISTHTNVPGSSRTTELNLMVTGIQKIPSALTDLDASPLVPQGSGASSAKVQPRRVSTATLELLRKNLLKRQKTGGSMDSLSEESTDEPVKEASPSETPRKRGRHRA